MAVENRYQIDVNMKSRMFREIPEVVANDKVIFEIKVYDGSVIFPLLGTYTYHLTSLKPGGQSIIREGSLLGDVIVFELGTSEMTVPGKIEGTVQIFDENNDRISSSKFDYVVKRDPSLQGSLPADDTTLVIANESLLTDAISKADNADNRIDNIVAQAGTDNTEIVDMRLRNDGTVAPTAGGHLRELSTQLAEKVAQKDINNYLTLKRDKAVKLAMEDLADDVLSAMTGGATVNVLSVPQDGSASYEKLGQDLKRAIDDNIVNLYDPSLAIDGKLNGYNNGVYSDYANGAVSGKIPVEPGKTYTISMPSTEKGFDAAFRCFDGAGVFIGNSRAVSTNPIASGASSGTQITANNRKQVTLTLTSDTKVRFVETSIIFPYTTHTTADFDRIRNSIQFEEGASFLQFEPYGTAIPRIYEVAMPSTYDVLKNDVSAIKQILNGDATLIKSGNTLNIRTAWDSKNDLLQKMEIVQNGGYSRNEVFQFTNYGLIPKGTAVEDTLSAVYTQIKVSTDDSAPFQYNGTYIGASHGAYDAVNLLANAHGKTVQDIGSEWLDSSGRKYYIIRIVDANNIWVLSENIVTNGTWDFDTTVEGTTLNHSADAINTGAITFTAQTISQIFPAVKNGSRKILLNNKVEVIEDGTYNGESIQIVESYDISSPLSLIDYLKSRAGSSVEPSFTDDSIGVDVRNIITYSFQNNGACTVYSSAEFINQVKIDYFGMVQSNALPVPNGGKIYEYIPKTLPTSAGGITYDPKNKADITNLSASLDIPKSSWEQADNPPERFVQFTENSSGVKQHGITVGYCPTIGIGKKQVRSTLINSAFSMPTTKKQYPKAVSKGNAIHAGDIVPSGSFYEGVAFRVPINYSLYGDATNVSWYEVNGAIYLMIDYHSNVDKKLQLPNSFLNKQIEVIEKTDSFNLLSSFVNPDGIRFRISGDYGYAVLKLS